MKRLNADEISRWLMDDTLVAQRLDHYKNEWVTTDNPLSWETIRVSIATVEGKPLFVGDTYYDPDGMLRQIHANAVNVSQDFWDKRTLTRPKPKSILDSEEFRALIYSSCSSYQGGSRFEALKQFLRDNKEKI